MLNLRTKRNTRLILLEIVLIVFLIIWIYPLINILLNSFKPVKDMMLQFLDAPKELRFENYVDAWTKLDFPKAILNTFLVTVFSVGGIVLFGSMAAYKLARMKTKLSYVILMLCISPMLIPFQTIMITLTQVAKALHLTGSIWGLVIMYWGISTPFTIFLYHGFIKMVPISLDESATIDGASSFKTFFKIIFPLLKSVTITSIVINALYIWNDFLLPLLMVSSNKATRTIQIALYTNFGIHEVKWTLALPGLIISILPAIIFFIIMQKHIIKGIAGGAVKG